MLSKTPVDLKKVSKKHLDCEVLRQAIIAELDAVSLYEQLAAVTENRRVAEILLDVAREEKTHVGEFQALLLQLDQEQTEELKQGKSEVEEKFRK